MLKKYLWRDLSKNRLIMSVLFVFIMLAAMTAAAAAGVIMELTGSVHSLFEKAAAPHYAQMYSGGIDQEAIRLFSRKTGLVKQQQTVVLLNISGSDIFLGNDRRVQTDSIFENSFVIQNSGFDFLLDRNNEIMQVSPGEIGVPICYMKQQNLKPGDTVAVSKDGFQMAFTIRDFVRDAQMNPSLVTSKRFLVNASDWDILEEHIGEKEYMIEFLLNDAGKISSFESMYQSSALPQAGTSVTGPLFMLINAMSDGITAAVIILVSLILTAVSFISLRFILLSAMEEDYREIGGMKAIGISDRRIRSLYLTKYLLIGAIACACGYLLSMLPIRLLTADIIHYMGKAEPPALYYLMPAAAALLVFVTVACFCSAVLGRLKRITPSEALRRGSLGDSRQIRHLFKLQRSGRAHVNLFLSWNELAVKYRTYGLICLVFTACMFLMAVPLHFLNTIQSPAFISYMGAGRSDIRIDMSRTGNLDADHAALMEQLEQDPDVDIVTSFAASVYKIQNRNGEEENIRIENGDTEYGDFKAFPLTYVSGRGPGKDSEIALSYMSSRDLGLDMGSTVCVRYFGREYRLTVCGIYQDITNGGKTAKAMLPREGQDVLWYVVNLDTGDGVNISRKVQQYAAAFPQAKVTDMGDYISQTFGSVIRILVTVTALTLILAAAVSMLITVLFLKMLITRERTQIAAMYSMGFCPEDIRRQYGLRMFTVLGAGILAGTAAAGTVGPYIAGMLLPGISHMRFIINPFISYLLCPLLLFLCVGAVTAAAVRQVEDIRVMALLDEG